MMKYYCLRVIRRIGKHLSAWMFRWRAQCSDPEHVQGDFLFYFYFFSWQLISAIPFRLLTWSEDSVLQMEVSTLVEFFLSFFYWHGSGNNGPSVDDLYATRKDAIQATSLPRMRKIICEEKDPAPPQEAAPPRLPCPKCDKTRNLLCLVIFILIWTVFIWR